MDRNQQAVSANLRDQENRIIADILQHYGNVMLSATSQVSNKSTAGEAVYNSMHMEIESQGLIKSVEDLLSLTRHLRELWVVGPLRKPGEGEAEAEATIDTEVSRVASLLDALREQSRQAMAAESNGRGSFASAPLEAPRLEGQQQQQQPQ